MSDRLEETQKVVLELTALMRKYNALITLDPGTHTAQVIYLPEKIAKKSADSLERRYMYNVIMEGEIGFSPEIQEQLGLDEPVTKVPDEQVDQVRKFMEYVQYFSDDDNPDWLKDLGIEDEGKEDKE